MISRSSSNGPVSFACNGIDREHIHPLMSPRNRRPHPPSREFVFVRLEIGILPKSTMAPVDDWARWTETWTIDTTVNDDDPIRFHDYCWLGTGRVDGIDVGLSQSNVTRDLFANYKNRIKNKTRSRLKTNSIIGRCVSKYFFAIRMCSVWFDLYW